MVTEICTIVFMVTTLANLFILWRKQERLDRDTYSMFINYSKALEAVKGDVQWVQQNRIEPLERSQEQVDKKLDELSGKVDAHSEDIDELNKLIVQLRGDLDDMQKQLQEYETPIEDGSPEAEMIRGLQNIFNFSGGVQ